MTKMQFFLMSLLPTLLQSPDERLISNCNLDKVKLTLKTIIVLMSINTTGRPSYLFVHSRLTFTSHVCQVLIVNYTLFGLVESVSK